MSSNAVSSSSTEPLRQELGAFLAPPPRQERGAAFVPPLPTSAPPAPPVSIHFRRRIRKEGVPAVTAEFKRILQQVETELPGRAVGYSLRRSHIGGYVHLHMEGDAALVNRFIDLAIAAGWRPYGSIAISEVIAVRPIPRHGEEEFPAENYNVRGHSIEARKREEGAAAPVTGVDETTAAIYRRGQSAHRYGGYPYGASAAAVRGALMAENESPNVGESPPRILVESNANYERRKHMDQTVQELGRRMHAAQAAYYMQRRKVGGRRSSAKAGKKAQTQAQAQVHRKTQKRKAK